MALIQNNRISGPRSGGRVSYSIVFVVFISIVIAFDSPLDFTLMNSCLSCLLGEVLSAGSLDRWIAPVQ